MDDILRAPQSRTAPSPKQAVRAKRNGSVAAARRIQQKVGSAIQFLSAVAAETGRVARRTSWHVAMRLEGHRFGRLPFLVISLSLGAILAFSLLYQTACEVSLDGEVLGVIQSQDDFEAVVDRVETRASKVLGYAYQFEYTPTYKQVIVPKGEYVSAAAFETDLFRRVGEVMQAYVLTVDGEFIGASESREELESMLSAIQEQYVDEDVTSVGFLQDVRITHQYTSTDKLQERTLSDMQAMLTANTNGATTYIVVSGDTLTGIAYRNNMSLKEIMELNPNINAHNLSIGQTIIIREVIPYLSVTTTKTLTYEDAIPFDTQYVDNHNMYQGDSRVVKAGVKGKAVVTADVTYVNGKQTESTILSSQTILEPTTQIVEVGTAPRPKTAPTGSFKWPVYGSITSRYGYRSIFGSYSFHSGIDIAAPYGTTIRASDGGTVTYAGYKGSYGYLVIISHGSSGKQTYYAHCSKLLVSTGTKVYQGQAIARVGLSGRTTGSHLHFEVRINGSTVNPLSYLK